jgi:gliding motility-associated lipoprotein GldH
MKNETLSGRISGYLCVSIVIWTIAFSACERSRNQEMYYSLGKETWDRFNHLRFEIPVDKPVESCDVIIFIKVTSGFTSEVFDFNMILTTPSGEERINAFQIKIKNQTGEFIISRENDLYQAEIPLIRALNLTKTGKLLIELENLTPRLHLYGIKGIGIRLSPSGK